MSISRLLNNRYHIDELIGRGGMADVYKGQDELLHRPVAVKMLRTELARDPQFQARFRREAQASAALNHPAIVAVYDTGTETMQDNELHQVDCPFIVMEYVQGRTLRELLDSGPLPVQEAVKATCGVLEAMSYAHEKSIVHRDIKPSNVMVCLDGEIKVMDFGIARALSDSSATMTQTSAVVGTAQYLSPEQARGDDVDTRSDIYSAGCLLFELLTGRPPFVGDSPVALAYQHVSGELPKASALNPEVSDHYDAVLARALAKDRADRYQSAAEFSAALLMASQGHYPPGSTGGTESAAATEAISPVAATAAVPVAAAASGEPTSTLAASAAYPETPDEEDSDLPEGYESVAYQEEKDPQRRSGGARIATVVALVIVLLAALGVGGYFLVNYLNDQRAAAERVTVPDVANKPQNEAQNILVEAGFRPIVKEVNSAKVKKGYAIDTSPAAGEKLGKDSEITLNISIGPDQVIIPKNLQGQSEATVRDKLNELGLTVERVETADSATVPRDRLLSTTPALGSKVKVGTTVDLVLSSGQVTMPNLVGLTEADAQKKASAKDVRLNLEIRYEETKDAIAGTVISQDKTAGQKVEQGSTVVVTIATKPQEPTESPSEDDDEDSSPSPSPSPSKSKKN